MEIIKHGDPEKIKRIKQCWSVKRTCPQCGCIFVTRDGEMHPRTEHDAGYATCPDCGSKAS